MRFFNVNRLVLPTTILQSCFLRVASSASTQLPVLDIESIQHFLLALFEKRFKITNLTKYDFLPTLDSRIIDYPAEDFSGSDTFYFSLKNSIEKEFGVMLSFDELIKPIKEIASTIHKKSSEAIIPEKIIARAAVEKPDVLTTLPYSSTYK